MGSYRIDHQGAKTYWKLIDVKFKQILESQ